MTTAHLTTANLNSSHTTEQLRQTVCLESLRSPLWSMPAWSQPCPGNIQMSEVLQHIPYAAVWLCSCRPCTCICTNPHQYDCFGRNYKWTCILCQYHSHKSSHLFHKRNYWSTKSCIEILSTFISWINLDLGIETCFYNGMDMYAKAWLQFLFPIYIWTIVGGMIVSSHDSSTAARLFRRHAVKVLATLFLLSFAKLQRTIITALSFTFLTYPNGTKTVWLYDSNIEYLRGKHISLFITALVALLFLLIPYTLALFFIQCLPRLNYRIFFWVRKLKPLFDAYTGPYKDKYRFWTGFLFIVRTILFLIFTLSNPGLNLAAVSITSTCLAFFPAVYK